MASEAAASAEGPCTIETFAKKNYHSFLSPSISRTSRRVRIPCHLTMPGSVPDSVHASAMLAELFEKARSAATRRPDGPAAVVQLVVGDDAYVIDTRLSTPPELVIRAERVQNADAEVSLDVVTLVALLDGSLPPLRAWTQKLITVKGDVRQLRALEWLSTVAGGKARSASSVSGATVQVRSANGEAGHGVYELQVTEEAACWTVWRRWSELKLLSTELSAEFGAGAPF